MIALFLTSLMLKVGDMKIRAQNKIIRNGKVDLCQNMYKVSENKKIFWIFTATLVDLEGAG